MMSSPILQLLRLDSQSFFAGTVAILGLLTSAFSVLLQYPVLSPRLCSFTLSIYCAMMMLCILALCADCSLRSRNNSSTLPWSEILRTIAILTGSMAIISLLFVSKPFIALVSFLVWLLLATYLILTLYRVTSQGERATAESTAMAEPMMNKVTMETS